MRSGPGAIAPARGRSATREPWLGQAGISVAGSLAGPGSGGDRRGTALPEMGAALVLGQTLLEEEEEADGRMD